MGIRTVVLTRDVENDKFWKRSFSSEEEAIEIKNILANRHCYKHEIIGLIKEKTSGHRWYICIKNPKRDWKTEVMFFKSKKSCILAAKLIKDYDNDLITNYAKYY